MHKHEPEEHHLYFVVTFLHHYECLEVVDELVQLKVVSELLLLFQDHDLKQTSASHILSSGPHENKPKADDYNLTLVLYGVTLQSLDQHCVSDKPHISETEGPIYGADLFVVIG